MQRTKKVANIMDDKKFKLKPYYKKRDLEAEKIPFNQRLPKPIVNDLMQFFKDNQWNQTDGMTYLALDFLNNHCLERKEFDYSVLFVLNKDHDLKPDDLTAIGYIDKHAFKEDYFKMIDEDERQKYIELSGNDYEDNNYFYPMKIHDSSDYFKLPYDFKADEDGFLYFHPYDDFLKGKIAKNLDDLFYVLGFEFANHEKKTMPMSNGGNLFGLKVINLYLNNFLDVKSGGIYKNIVGLKHENFHRGIGVLQGADGLYYITYVWHIIESPYGNDVGINYMEFHSKEDWFDIVMNSTNADLKDFVLDLDDFIDIGKRDLVKDIEDIDKQILELQKRKKEYQEIIDNLFNDDGFDKKKII